MISREFILYLLVFWILAYLFGSFLTRKLGWTKIRVALFYLEASIDPDRIKNILSKLGNLLGRIGIVGVIFLLILALLSLGYLFNGTIALLTRSDASSAVVPVIPGVTFEITPPLLIAIFVALVAHEMGHAALTMYFGARVRKIAFFILFVLIGAFVEPDEGDVRSLSRVDRMKVYSGGVMMNLAIFFLVLTFSAALFPGFTMLVGTPNPSGVYVEEVIEGGPSFGVLSPGVVIKAIDGHSVRDLASLTQALANFRPGEEVSVVTDRGVYRVRLGQRPGDPDKAFLGVRLSPLPYFEPRIPMPTWMTMAVLETLFLILLFSMGLAALNSLPMLPLDGGLVLRELVDAIVRDEALANRIAWMASVPTGLMLIYQVLSYFLG